MTFNLIPGNADLNAITTVENQNILELKNQDKIKIFKDDQGTPVVQLSSNGLQTTPPNSGIDVTTATNSQYSFNSAQNTLKVIASGTATGSYSFPTHNATSGGTDTSIMVNIPLSYSFNPVALIYANINSGYQLISDGSTYAVSLGPSINVYTYFRTVVSGAQLLIDMYQSYSVTSGSIPSSSGSLSFKYYLFQETAS